jgi:hypothetical protein
VFTLMVVIFGIPILFFGWKLVLRLRLERQGIHAQATVTSVRNWTDSLDGIKHQTVSFAFPAGGVKRFSSANVPRRAGGYSVGDSFPVLYLSSRPDKAQPLDGGLATSTRLMTFAILALVAVLVVSLMFLESLTR